MNKRMTRWDVWPVVLFWATVPFQAWGGACTVTFLWNEYIPFYVCFLFTVSASVVLYCVSILGGAFVFIRALWRRRWGLALLYILHALCVFFFFEKVGDFFGSLHYFLIGHGWHEIG